MQKYLCRQVGMWHVCIIFINFVAMNRVQRYIHWLRRIGYCRGFGVQSPSAYRFIRYVVNEHYPYYAYSDLRRVYPGAGWLARKRMELYFRMANYCQAAVWHDFGGGGDMLRSYVQHGCRGTRVESIADGGELGGRVEVMRVCPSEGCHGVLASALDVADDGTVLIVEDIGRNAEAGRMWQAVLGCGKTSVSYDLYYLGIAFFDRKRFRRNYIVNF